MAALAEAGVEVVGENRAQDLESQARPLRRRVPLALHRPPPEPEGPRRERALRARPLARLRLGREAPRDPGTRPGEPRGRGVQVGDCTRGLEAFLEGSPVEVRGLSTMPPFADDPEASRPYFRRLRELAERHGLAELSMGTTQDIASPPRRGRPCSRRLGVVGQGVGRPGANIPCSMAFSDVWNRTLVYFGIAEEDDDDWDEDGYVTNEELERTYSERPNVRRLAPRRRSNSKEFDDWTDPEPEPGRTASTRPRRRPSSRRWRHLRTRRSRCISSCRTPSRMQDDRRPLQGLHAGDSQPPGSRLRAPSG